MNPCAKCPYSAVCLVLDREMWTLHGLLYRHSYCHDRPARKTIATRYQKALGRIPEECRDEYGDSRRR